MIDQTRKFELTNIGKYSHDKPKNKFLKNCFNKIFTAIAWHPFHEGLFVSGGGDGSIGYWQVNSDKEMALLEQAHDMVSISTFLVIKAGRGFVLTKFEIFVVEQNLHFLGLGILILKSHLQCF